MGFFSEVEVSLLAPNRPLPLPAWGGDFVGEGSFSPPALEFFFMPEGGRVEGEAWICGAEVVRCTSTSRSPHPSPSVSASSDPPALEVGAPGAEVREVLEADEDAALDRAAEAEASLALACASSSWIWAASSSSSSSHPSSLSSSPPSCGSTASGVGAGRAAADTAPSSLFSSAAELPPMPRAEAEVLAMDFTAHPSSVLFSSDSGAVVLSPFSTRAACVFSISVNVVTTRNALVRTSLSASTSSGAVSGMMRCAASKASKYFCVATMEAMAAARVGAKVSLRARVKALSSTRLHVASPMYCARFASAIVVFARMADSSSTCSLERCLRRCWLMVRSFSLGAITSVAFSVSSRTYAVLSP
mmetsp:Transcript_6967/g.14070  ORF Transcript_6967/g.14070 Transcript_6967/m.14070 type:complete len:360 (-) Transcript_6967:1315-2394(-)